MERPAARCAHVQIPGDDPLHEEAFQSSGCGSAIDLTRASDGAFPDELDVSGSGCGETSADGLTETCVGASPVLSHSVGDHAHH